MRLLCLILLFVSAKCFAQYPFEKLPVRKVDSVPFHIAKLKGKSSYIAVARYKTYRVEVLEDTLQDGSNILLFHNNKLVKRAKDSTHWIPMPLYPLYIYHNEDRINFLVAYHNDGNGLAAYHICKVYLSNVSRNNYQVMSYLDFYQKPSCQYQFSENSSYEIVCQSLAEYKGHNYWLFDLYNVENGQLVNVSRKYGYPIAVPYLLKETFTPTNKILKSELSKLSLKLSEFYTSN